jgi:hypothetical protein
MPTENPAPFRHPEPLLQQPPFPYNHPLLFVIPTGANPDFLPRSTGNGPCAAFSKESRMKLAQAANTNRKSGVA